MRQNLINGSVFLNGKRRKAAMVWNGDGYIIRLVINKKLRLHLTGTFKRLSEINKSGLDFHKT